MRSIGLILLLWFSGLINAQSIEEFALIQAQANLPVITLWLNLPPASVIKPEQFSVSVGSKPTSILSVDGYRQTGEGVAYIFLVDISKSLQAQQFQHIKQALQHWSNAMSDQDRAALLTFGNKVQQILPFSADHERLITAIAGLSVSDNQTSLYQGLLETMNLVRQQSPDLPARRAIVVLSDGMDDTVSGISVDDIITQSHEYQVPIYSIGFAAPPISEAKRQGLKIMGTLAHQSGGFFVQADADQIDIAYKQLQQHILQAYRIQINCPDCQADGQLYRLNLTWNDGQNILSDGLDLRLLPQHTAKPSPSPSPGSTDLPVALLIFSLGVCAFLIGLFMIYRQRLAKPPLEVFDPVTVTQPVVALAKPILSLSVKLTIVSGLQKGQTFQLPVGENTTLGRSSQCDLSLVEDVEISAQHAMLQYLENKLSIRDLNSTNGTLVNGVPIHNTFPLKSGDLILLGRTELRIEFSGKA